MMQELLVLWIALLAYVLAGTLAIGAAVLGKRPDRSVLVLILAGLALHTVSLALRWGRVGHGPFLTLFEILASNIWSLLLVFAIAYWRIKAVRPIAAVVMPILFLMMGWLLMTNPGEGHLPPTYHTIWLYIHVGFGKIFLGAVLVAVGLAGVIILRWGELEPRSFARLPDSARLEELAYRFLALGLVFETLMLLSGAIWAQDAWGRYWAWDPLETWALLTWLLLAFALHVRFTLKPSPAFGATMVLAVFALAFLTFFGVPFISTAAHQGAV
ncbi:MAG TPA: cytochrome c biogenesis protein CcsA [Burkholderiales bacterium]|nr:cytochrome c biogenesis protein CcsA [Burkholderiales bacterium]